jgi:DNA polymerase-3 subunit delta
VAKAKQVKWNQVSNAPVVLVSGAEDFLAARAIKSLRDSLRGKNPQLEISEVEAAEYESGRLIDLTTPSLFDEPRLVIINGVEKCSDALIEDGVAYLSDINAESTVVFRHVSGVRGKKLLEAIRSAEKSLEVVCDKLVKEPDRLAFAQDEFKAAAKKISNIAVRNLVSAFGDDAAGLASACQQLIQDVPGDIDEALVERYFGGRVEVDSFKVIDAATAGDVGQALTLLRHSLGSGNDPVALVGAIAHKVRLMAKHLNNRGATGGQLGNAQPWAIDRARRDLVGWTEAGMANVIIELARCDAATKGAERDPSFAVERLLLLIARKGV